MKRDENVKVGPTSFASALLLTVIVAGLIFAGIEALLWALSVELLIDYHVLIGTLVLTGLLFVQMFRSAWMLSKEEPVTVIQDAATDDELQTAIGHLATLPHMRLLSDGALFDLLHGSRIHPCECEQYSTPHLLVKYGQGRQHSIGLITKGALDQYLSVQDALAVQLRGH